MKNDNGSVYCEWKRYLKTLKNNALSKFRILNFVYYFWSEHLSAQFDGICVYYYLNEHHNTKNKFLLATFSSVCNKRFIAHLKLIKIFLTIFWTTKTGWEMTSRCIDSQALIWAIYNPLTRYCLFNAARVVV